MAALTIGLGLSTTPGPGIDPIGQAKTAEELGFDYVSASDHLHSSTPTYEPWTLLTTVAAVTSRVRVLTRVLAVPYRNPAVVAKMAESLDRLSGGRLILGLGGGYLDDEFRAFGLPAPSSRDKIDGLAEAIEIAHGLWSSSAFTYAGRLYRTEKATIEPKPDHFIPIWLGTYKPRGLALTGRLADGWIPSIGFAPPDQVGSLRERVFAAAQAAGRDPDAITCVYNLVVRVDETARAEGVTIAGSPDAVADRLIELTKLGFDSLSLIPTGPGTDEQIERLGREVLPAVRAGA